MTAVPKPKYCAQNWLDMTPTERGRICGQCNKVIFDFSKKSWVEIEKLQLQNNNSICGVYSPRQLDHWGQEIPKANRSNYVAAAALIVSLSASLEAICQRSDDQNLTQRTIIRGVVTGKPQQGNSDTLEGALVGLKNTKAFASTDRHGNYTLDVTDYIDTISNPTIMYFTIGYKLLEIKLDNSNKGNLFYDAQLTESNNNTISFYVTAPTTRDKLKWRLKKMFRRKKHK